MSRHGAVAAPAGGRHGVSVVGLAIRAVTVIGLILDAVIHFQLAPDYQLAAPGGIGQGNLFRIEAALAVLVALAVLIRPNRTTYAAAFLISAGGLAAVLLYRYVDVPALGPIPSMYEPVWFMKKSISAVAEAVAAVAALGGLRLIRQQGALT